MKGYRTYSEAKSTVINCKDVTKAMPIRRELFNLLDTPEEVRRLNGLEDDAIDELLNLLPRPTTQKEIDKLITPQMVEAAYAYMQAQAWVATIAPVVRGYQIKVLEELQAKNPETGKVILDPNYTWLMDEEDFGVYLKRVREERIKSKLEVSNPEFCPLLVAEQAVRDARMVLVEVTEALHTLPQEQIRRLPIAKIDRITDLTLRLLVPIQENKKQETVKQK